MQSQIDIMYTHACYYAQAEEDTVITGSAMSSSSNRFRKANSAGGKVNYRVILRYVQNENIKHFVHAVPRMQYLVLILS